MIRRPMRGSARLADVEPDMNITPLVDICLVLLIIFMVVAPRINQDIQVDLPGIFNPDPDIKSTMDPIKVAVPTANEYYVEDRRYDLDGLAAYLSERHAAEPFRKLLLQADAKLAYGDIRTLLARCQEIGFPGLSFLVGKRHRAGAVDQTTSGGPGTGSAAESPERVEQPPEDAGPVPAGGGAWPQTTGRGN